METQWAALIPRDILLDDPQTGLRDWLLMFAGKAIQAIPAQEVEQFNALVEAHCRVQLHRDGAWHADYRRIRVIARKRD